MTDLDTGPSSIRDDSICESSLPPNKSSGDIVERLKTDALSTSRATKMIAASKTERNQAAGDPWALYEGLEPEQTLQWQAAAEIERLRRELEAANSNHRSMAHLLAETGIRLEATRREVENLQRALLFWMPGVDLRLDEATRERAAQDAGLLAGYTEPLDGPCWGDGMIERALTAESAVAAAREDEREGCALVAENAYTGRTKTGTHPLQIARAIRARASAIRAAVSKKTAESGHSPSTREHD